MLARLMRKEPRCEPRFTVSVAVRMRFSGGEAATVQVENLSSWGFGAKGNIEIRPGSLVSLELPDLRPATAKIAWVSGDRFGAEFLKPITKL
jgi:hypothetical protein